jgi:hypothetical protein
LSQTALWWVQRGARIDRVSIEVHEALSAAEIPAVLLKGPSIAAWLYTDGSPREYGDSDFLIRRGDWERAHALLLSRGFVPRWEAGAHRALGSYGSFAFLRGDDAVDLHATIQGLHADFDTVWRILTADLATQQVLYARLPVLGVPARAMHLALHAAQHHVVEHKPAHDLSRGLAKLDDETWRAAADLAAELGALAAFGSGLRMSPEGRALAERLQVPVVVDTATLVREQNVPLAEGVHELLETRGLRPRVRLVVQELAPRPAFMRRWSPIARRGRGGLVLSYVLRPIWLLRRVPAALRAVRRARRRSATRGH